MAVSKRTLKTSKPNRTGVVNLTTGNTIFRDSSDGHFFVIKQSGGERISSKTTGKRKAEQAEKAVLSYLNESRN
jgi:hypothetical protein